MESVPRSRHRRRLLVAALGAVAVALALLPLRPASADTGLQATIRRTQNGVPRILAHDWTGLGFGYGYAFAQDDICTIADSYVTVDAQRSRYFGPGGSWFFAGNGSTNNNLNSDFFFQEIIDERRVEQLVALPPPLGPRQEIRDAVRGYVAGYNRYLADTGVQNLPDPTCRGKAWVHPITEMEAYRRFYQLALLASSAVAIDGIGSAQPPGAGTMVPSPATQAQIEQVAHGLDNLGIGSNAVALGAAGTQNGRGLLLGNPHFPWYGSERFYESQLTIPGVVNVSGASLFGVPAILIGHTDTMAWSHTVSTARRFTIYQLTLAPGDPTSYIVDGQTVAMQRHTLTVQALQSDGSLAAQSRTLYETRWGPMLTSILGLPIFPWSPLVGFAMGDANANNFRYLNHFLETDMAHSSAEELQVLQRNQGIPWVNTIVSDSGGTALYADIGVVPNVTDAKVQQCNTPAGQATWQLARIAILDGSTSSCAWDNDPDAIQKGTFGPSHLPKLFRSDYVENSNDSYWLSNPHQPLTGFPLIVGDEGTARSLRTRIGLTMIEQRLHGTDGLAGVGFDRGGMQYDVLADRQYGGELARDATVTMCQSFPGGLAPSASGPVDVSQACPVLAAWDLHENLDSKGAVLWRDFWERALAAKPSPWADSFNVNDPVNTPHTLDTGNDPQGLQVQAALGDAVHDVQAHGLPLDATLGGVQYADRSGEHIPIHGGVGDPDGEFNAIYRDDPTVNGSTTGLDAKIVADGSSFIQVVSFTGTPCPDTRTILTYSESTNPTSPHFADQTRMFSQKQWKVDEFCESQIAADPTLTITVVTEPTATVVTALPNTATAARGGAPLVALGGLVLAWRRLRRRST